MIQSETQIYRGLNSPWELCYILNRKTIGGFKSPKIFIDDAGRFVEQTRDYNQYAEYNPVTNKDRLLKSKDYFEASKDNTALVEYSLAEKTANIYARPFLLSMKVGTKKLMEYNPTLSRNGEAGVYFYRCSSMEELSCSEICFKVKESYQTVKGFLNMYRTKYGITTDEDLSIVRGMYVSVCESNQRIRDEVKKHAELNNWVFGPSTPRFGG